MRIEAAALSMLLVACSADDSSSRPSSCRRSDRAGTYYLQTTVVESTCGRQGPGGLLTLRGGDDPLGPGCTMNSQRWSEGDCKLERDFTCTDGRSATRTIAVTRDEVGDGSRLSGTITVTSDDCRSTYTAVVTRQ